MKESVIATRGAMQNSKFKIRNGELGPAIDRFCISHFAF